MEWWRLQQSGKLEDYLCKRRAQQKVAERRAWHESDNGKMERQKIVEMDRGLGDEEEEWVDWLSLGGDEAIQGEDHRSWEESYDWDYPDEGVEE
jgi:hypothetical protein